MDEDLGEDADTGRCRGCLRSSNTPLCTSLPPLATLRASLEITENVTAEPVLLCPYCSVRMKQCLQFINMVKKADKILSCNQQSLHDLQIQILNENVLSQPRLNKYEVFKIELPSVDQQMLNYEVFSIIQPITKQEIKIEFTEDHKFLNEDAGIDCDENNEHFKSTKRKISKTLQDFVDEETVSEIASEETDYVKIKNIIGIDKLNTKQKKSKTKHNLGDVEFDKEIDSAVKLDEDTKTKRTSGVDKSYISKKRKKIKTKQTPLRRVRGKEMEQRVESMKFEILYLSKTQQLQEVKDRKMTEKYSKSPYKCEMCGSAFVIKQSFENHMVKHSEERGGYGCDVCRLRFKTSRQLQCHMRDHSRHFRCVVCGETVYSYTDCDRHYARCAGYSGAVCCQYCGKQSENSYTLHKHILKIHQFVKKFTCDYCQKDFRQKVSLQNHIRNHTGERPFSCQTCGQSFAKYTCLKQHALVHNPTRSHYCVECDKTYRSYSALLQHLARSPQHCVNRDTFKHPCSECGKRFFSPSELATHVNTAHVKSPLQCPDCPKVYYRKEILKKHIRIVHEGYVPPRTHPCDVCGKAFTENFRLVNHMRTHTGVRPFSCDQCPASFAHKSAVWGHKRAKHAAKHTAGNVQ